MDWSRKPTPEERHISGSSPPDFDDPLDSILRRQPPRQTHYPHSDHSEEEKQSRPIEYKVLDPTRKGLGNLPQRYSPPLETELLPGPSRYPTRTNQPIRRRRLRRDPPQDAEPRRRGRPKKDPAPETSRPQRGRRSQSTQTVSNSLRPPRQLRGKKRGRPLEVTPKRDHTRVPCQQIRYHPSEFQ